MAVETVGMDRLDYLGIDELNRLYWKGELIVTESTLVLPTWVDWAVGAAGVATVVIALILGLEYFNIRPRRGSPSVMGRSN